MLTQRLCESIQAALPSVLDGRDRIQLKEDNSYVSEGDLLIQSIAESWVRETLPDYLLISEEMAPFKNDWDPFGKYVVLDPIDGTENFISGLKEWGVGVSIYATGKHRESCIYLPELGERQITGMPIKRYRSRIMGLSSSLTTTDVASLQWDQGFEYRIIGCAMYNMLMAARGSYQIFENVKGVNCWDILPGLNLAREAGCKTWVDGIPYDGQLLLPTRKYRVKIQAPASDLNHA
jgi:myo-inositol-1(or 4)-monophosphatase